MKINLLKSLFIGVSLMGGAHQANAEIYNFTDGAASPTVMATLNVTETATINKYLFELEFKSLGVHSANFANLDLLAIATSTPGQISLTNFNSPSPSDVTKPVVASGGIATSIINGVTFNYNHAFDFADKTQKGNKAFELGEAVSWEASYSAPLVITDMTTVFLNNGGKQPKFFALAVAAVPEPETYAMFLAGLGLLGFKARKRKNT